MKDEILLGVGKSAIKVLVRKSDRAKCIAVRIIKNNQAELVIPKRETIKRAKAFLYEKESWIRSKISDEPKKIPFIEGAEIPIFGVMHKIVLSDKKDAAVHINDGKIIVYVRKEWELHEEILLFLYNMAYNELSQCVDKYAKNLKKEYGKIAIRDTSSRWGSCSYNGNLSFCWRIVLAPKEVLHYLAAHEVSHLIEKNHGENFWSLVEIFCHDYKQQRLWLRKNSARLHSYG